MRAYFVRCRIPLILFCASALLFFAAGEAAVRIYSTFDRNSLDRLANPRTSRPGREFTLADIIRLHPDDRIVYELRPGITGTFLGRELALNALGMRDGERRWEKPAGVFRIACLGDSHTFGWGVAQKEAYPAVLEELLASRFPGRAFESWNLGVPGYNAVMEVAAFAAKVDRLDPDLVLINYVDNDMDLPNFLARPPDPLTFRRSFLLELVKRRVHILLGEYAPPLGLVDVLPDERTGRFVIEEKRIPPRFRPLAGRDRMEGAYHRLAALARERGIPAAVSLTWGDYRGRLAGRTADAYPASMRELERLGRDEGFLIVDPQERFVDRLTNDGLPAGALWVSPRDSHMSPLAHRLMAEEIIETLVKEGVLE